MLLPSQELLNLLVFRNRQSIHYIVCTQKVGLIQDFIFWGMSHWGWASSWRFKVITTRSDVSFLGKRKRFNHKRDGSTICIYIVFPVSLTSIPELYLWISRWNRKKMLSQKVSLHILHIISVLFYLFWSLSSHSIQSVSCFPLRIKVKSTARILWYIFSLCHQRRDLRNERKEVVTAFGFTNQKEACFEWYRWWGRLQYPAVR